MSKIKNTGLDQYGAEPFEQQQFGTVGVEGVNEKVRRCIGDRKAKGLTSPCNAAVQYPVLLYIASLPLFDTNDLIMTHDFDL